MLTAPSIPTIALVIITLFVPYSWAKTLSIVTINQDFAPLSKGQAKMIYRGKSTKLHGKKIELLDLPSESKTRSLFYQNLLRKNHTQMHTQWASLAFSGRVQAPVELQIYTKESILEWTMNHPNGIAYVDLEEIPQQLNILYQFEVNE